LIYNLIKSTPLFFTGSKLRPPGIGTEDTLCDNEAKATDASLTELQKPNNLKMLTF